MFSAGIQTKSVVYGTRQAEIAYAPIALTGTGAQTLVAGVVGKKIIVLAMRIVADTDIVVSFSGGSPVSGSFSVGPENPLMLSASPYGWFITAAGQALKLSADDDIDGQLVYAIVE